MSRRQSHHDFLALIQNTPEIFAKIIDTHIVSLKDLALIASTHRSCHHAPEIRARYGILKKANFVCEATKVLNKYVGANARPSALFESDPDRAEIFLAAACINPEFALTYAPPEILRDREFVLEIVSRNRGEIIRFLGTEARNDRQVWLTAVKSGLRFRHISDEWKKDRGIILAYISKWYKYIGNLLNILYALYDEEKYILSGIKAALSINDVVALAVVKCHGKALQFAIDEIKSDRKIVLAAVTQCGDSLQYASQELRNNREIVLAAVTQNGYALGYASQELRNDREICLTAVTQNGYALTDASQELRNNREIVLAAVTQNGKALKYASQELQNDSKIVLAAITQRGHAEERERKITLEKVKSGMRLREIRKEHRGDREIFLAALKNSPRWDIEDINASDELLNDKEVMLKAISINVGTYKYVSSRLKDDREVVLAVALAGAKHGSNINHLLPKYQMDREFFIAYNYRDLECAPSDLRADSEFMYKAITVDGYNLKYASEELKNDRQFVLCAVSGPSDRSGYALQFASEELKKDRFVVLAAILNCSSALKYASEELKRDRTIVLTAILNDSEALKYASEELKNDRQFVLWFLSGPSYRSGYALQYVSEELKRDRMIVLAAVSKCVTSLQYAALHLRNDRQFILTAFTRHMATTAEDS